MLRKLLTHLVRLYIYAPLPAIRPILTGSAPAGPFRQVNVAPRLTGFARTVRGPKSEALKHAPLIFSPSFLALRRVHLKSQPGPATLIGKVEPFVLRPQIRSEERRVGKECRS